MNAPTRQRGVALLLVLWACTLLAILLGGYAALARTEGLQAHYQFAQTQAHYDAEAGLMRAVYGLHDPQPNQLWIGDGRTYTFHYDNATVKVSALGEGGKVDINKAPAALLEGLFTVGGMPSADAAALAGHVLDWRNPAGLAGEADQQRAAYAAAGRAYGPRHGLFPDIEELQMVLGMTPALYRRISPWITVWAGNTGPDTRIAPAQVLAAIPGMTSEQQQVILAARLKDANNPGMALNSGTTHSIRSEATLADGTHAVLHATIRWQIGQAQPYVVLRWQEGDTE